MWEIVETLGAAGREINERWNSCPRTREMTRSKSGRIEILDQCMGGFAGFSHGEGDAYPPTAGISFES
jgi:hypothetical protein